MRWIIVLILFVVCLDTFAANYYVGGAGASDNNPGTSAQPFATIQKAASVTVAGDIVTIRSGTYRETVVPANSGTSGNPITFQPENGASVTISGSNPITGAWSVHSGSIYKTAITMPVNGYNGSTSNNTTLLANQLFKDGVMMFEARWPEINNLDDLLDRAKFRPIPASTANTITDSAIPANLVGATVWVTGWYVTGSGTVTAHSGSTITSSLSQSDPKKRKFYYLTGKLNLLNQEKEWHYENGTLYFWQPGGGSPTGVEYKARNYGFDLRGKSGIAINGIQFFSCNPVEGNTSTTNIVVDGIKAKYINHAVIHSGSDALFANAKLTGIKLIGPNNVIKNSELRYASSQAIWLGENCTAENNLISDIAYDGNYGAGVSFWEATGNQNVLRNTIRRTGRSAIDFGYLRPPVGKHHNVEIGYNDIYHFGMINVDLGGIYGSRGVDLTGTRIHHNWIHDSKAYPTADGIQTGLYFDQASGPTTSDHNVLWNNVLTDYYVEPHTDTRDAGSSRLYNNTFATNIGGGGGRHSYKSASLAPIDIQRNNIYRDDIIVKLGEGTPDVAYSLLHGIDPQFTGSGAGGLIYQLKSTSPAINKGMVIPGITDGSVGVPDMGAYEYGGTAWVPGYTPQTSTTPNTAPVVSIVTPANNTSFTQGTAIAISATATDADGSVARVEFFNGTTKLGEDLTTPYNFNWTTAPVGTHTITVRATDNQSGVTTSTPITIIITANTPPTILITSPANNSQFITGTPITISATASDANGSINKVEFFAGSTKLGEDLTTPYTFAWNNASIGSHTITARATDNENNSTTSTAVTISVGAVIIPTVSITAPSNNAQIVTGTPVTITATASDANGTVSKVEFFAGTTKLGEDLTSPYSFVWNSAPAGTHTVTARATDNENNLATSTAIGINIGAAIIPTVSITTPSNNSQVTIGAPIAIAATASDANGTVSKVEFFLGTTKLGEDMTSPYSFVWNNASTGTHTVTARATDNENNLAISSGVAVTVLANTPPTTSITAPANNSQFTSGTPITITAAASDANGSVTKVEFFSGTAKLGEDLTSPYSFVWNNAAVGTHTLTARATDNGNSVTTSAGVTITINANTAPTVSLTAPSNNAQFTAGSSITITATAADANGSVTKVEFFNGTTKLGEDATSPYSFIWANVPAGSYSISAKATDNQTAVGTSASVLINVVGVNAPPVVNITSPSSNSTFDAGSTITLTATASDANGSVTKVEFFRGTTKIGEDLTSPYSFVWTGGAIGTHSITAKASDNQAAVASSTPVVIKIVANTPPVVSITSPSNNSSFASGSSLTLSATATDANGSVTKVEFYNGTTKLGEDLSSPYAFTWNNLSVGSYTITARATDNQNAITTSAPVQISVVNPTAPTADAGEDVFLTLPDNSITLTGEGISPDGTSITFNWAQVTGPNTLMIFNSALPQVELTNLIEGEYVFELTVTNAKGLSGKDEVSVTVAGMSQDLQSAIPRYFSPNNDGNGDFWEWSQTESFENSVLSVFNRFGQKIYEAVSYKNTWDGKLGDKALQAGDYYYVIQLVNNTILRGSLQIVR